MMLSRRYLDLIYIGYGVIELHRLILLSRLPKQNRLMRLLDVMQIVLRRSRTWPTSCSSMRAKLT